jgi:hypothetical protein
MNHTVSRYTVKNFRRINNPRRFFDTVKNPLRVFQADKPYKSVLCNDRSLTHPFFTRKQGFLKQKGFFIFFEKTGRWFSILQMYGFWQKTFFKITYEYRRVFLLVKKRAFVLYSLGQKFSMIWNTLIFLTTQVKCCFLCRLPYADDNTQGERESLHQSW